MKIGTKSLLFGAHQFLLHPIMVMVAWWKLFGFPSDYRLWIAFLVHDWGYWGLAEMDGDIGDWHPKLGQTIMGRLFGREWGSFCLLHSRFLAKFYGTQPSKLCFADKYSLVLEPWWFYLPRAWATGELSEYLKNSGNNGKYGHMNLKRKTARQWYKSVQDYLRQWVMEHKDGKEDITTVNISVRPVSKPKTPPGAPTHIMDQKVRYK
jgi:hypothetical protein